ncbi:MAG: TlpA disulfide reductase family protein [Bacteroidota bacterium]
MMNTLRFLLVTHLILAWGFVSSQIVYENQKAPQFSMDRWINEAFDPADVEGKPILLEFWATWCGGCVAAIPDLNEWQRTFGQEINFVSVNSFDEEDKILQFLNRVQMETHIFHDESQELKQMFDIGAIPVAILIDKDGYLRWRGFASNLDTSFFQIFLEEDSIITYDRSVNILDERFTTQVASEEDSLSYTVKMKRYFYNQTQKSTKSLEWEFDEGFHVGFSNFPVKSILNYLFELQEGKQREWRFEGELSIDYTLDLDVESASPDHKRYLVDRTIMHLSQSLNFDLRYSKETLERWYLEPMGEGLKQFESLEQGKEPETEFVKDEYVDLKNANLESIPVYVSLITSEKIKWEGDDRKEYDVKIPMIKDIEKLRIHLEETYGLTLVKKSREFDITEVVFR